MTSDFPWFITLTAIFGLSIFLSLPIVYWRRAQGKWADILNAVAIGILVFLLADIFSDVAPIIYSAGATTANAGYVASPYLTLVFFVGLVVAFLGLFAIDSERLRRTVTGSDPAGSPALRTGFIIALGIGLQNLTEGLVFGANWVATDAFAGILVVIFLGFFVQNVTEGFPIASPWFGNEKGRSAAILSGLFLIGGLPTLIGGWIGYSAHPSNAFFVFVDALAIGAIAYAILPMLRVAFRPLATRELAVRRNELVYLGCLVGFALGFLTNAI